MKLKGTLLSTLFIGSLILATIFGQVRADTPTKAEETLTIATVYKTQGAYSNTIANPWQWDKFVLYYKTSGAGATTDSLSVVYVAEVSWNNSTWFPICSTSATTDSNDHYRVLTSGLVDSLLPPAKYMRIRAKPTGNSDSTSGQKTTATLYLMGHDVFWR